MNAKPSRFGPALLISKWRSVVTRQPREAEAALPDAEDTAAVPVPPPAWSEDWRPDALLEGFETRTYAMTDRPHLPEEPEGYLKATLIRAHAPKRRRAVLFVHGWNEYFFQRHLAAFYENLGYDFYAIDLHRYGRSLQAGELPGYMEAVEEFYEELDAAVAAIAEHHSQILLNGHSTGGLIAGLYASDRPGVFVGVILNSPWLDLQGSALFKALTPPLMRGLAVASPTMVLPAAENELYGRSLHVAYQGEWEYDLGLKRIESQPLRPGWIRAVVNGHDRVSDGLHIDCPTLVVTSARSTTPKEWCDDVSSTDLALDVDRIAAKVHLLGWHVTLVRLAGALHDVALSRQDVRERYFDEIRRWDLAYVRGRKAQEKAAAAAE